MKCLITLLFLAMLPLVCAADDAAETKGMINALKKYREALVAGQTDAAVSLTASFSDLPAEAVKSKTQDYVEATRSGRLRIWIFPTSAKVIDGCGALIIGDGEEPAADDPAYMIKQGDEWKVLLKLTNWNQPYFKITEEQKKAFEQLQTHISAQKKELRAASNPKVE
jgi:hypothetical protein